MTLLDIQCFGTIQVSISGQPLTSFGAEKVRALLIYLVVESERPHTRRRLAGLLWPEQPEERALHNLRQALSSLRKLLPENDGSQPYLMTAPDTVQFNPRSSHRLDVHAFHQHLDEALSPLDNRARFNLPLLQSALALYTAPFLEHFSVDDSSEFEEWAFMLRESCNQRAIQSLALLVDYHEQRHEFELARRSAERLVELAPWDETAHNQVIRLLAQDGQWSVAQARYQTLRRYLTEQMGLEPSSETAALFEQVRRAAAARKPLPPRCPPPLHNLRLPSTPFIGRAAEQLRLAGLLADSANRLITLLGTGGMGKSRLALQAAHSQIGFFPDGVWFIPTGERTLAPTIADALQLNLSGLDDPQSQLFNLLSRKRALLILDSFEHIQAEAAVLAQLLEAAPGIVILVTSRLRLDLHNEIILQVDGLDVPPSLVSLEASPEQYSAPALFLARVRRLRHNPRYTTPDLSALLDICRLLEGMPLGLELAASAAWNRSLPDIAAEIRANLDFLTTCCPDLPARHRSLRAVFDQSWSLLPAGMQLALARLAAFRSSFRAASGALVAQCSPDEIAALLDRSLLRQNGDGRLQLPEPILPYAAEKLPLVDPQPELAHARHAQHFAELFEAQSNRFRGAQMQAALEILLPELDNARQAWQWAVENEHLDLLDRTLHPLHQVLYTRSAFLDAIRLFESAFQCCQTRADGAGLAARLSTRLGLHYMRTGEQAQAQSALSRGLTFFRDAHQPEETILALANLANIHRKRGEPAETQRLVDELLERSQSAQHLEGQRSAYYLQGQIHLNQGDLPQALQAMNHSLEIARQLGSPLGLLTSLNALGDAYCNQEQYSEASRLFEECLEISRSLGSLFHQSIHLNNLGTVHHMLEDYDKASRYYRESLQICQDTGDLEGVGVALSNLGEVATLLADHAAAQEYYSQAIEIGRRIHSAFTIAVAHNNLGETLRRMGDLPRAWENFSQGLRTARQSETLSQVMESLAGLGMILLKTGRAELGRQALQTVLAHPISEPKDRQLAAEGLKGEPSIPAPADLDALVAQILAARVIG